MRSFLPLIFVFLVACASTPKTAEAPAPEARPIIIGEQREVASAALGEARTVNIWLPPSYDDGDKRYPVLYVIDGGLKQDFHHISGLAQLGAITGMFEEVIVVGVETKDRRAELTYRSTDDAENRDFPTNGKSGAFRTFLARELKPMINAKYRTKGSGALIGESLAGLFIVETFLKEPAAADAYIAISPSLWWDRGSLGKDARKTLDDYSSGDRKIYLAIASEKGVMREALREIVGALKKEKPKGVGWSFTDRHDLEHSTIYHREALEALIWTFGGEKRGEK